MNMINWIFEYVMSYGLYHLWFVIFYRYDIGIDMFMIHVKCGLQYCAIMLSICYCMWDILYLEMICSENAWYELYWIMSMSHMA